MRRRLAACHVHAQRRTAPLMLLGVLKRWNHTPSGRAAAGVVNCSHLHTETGMDAALAAVTLVRVMAVRAVAVLL
jgi:hypothetical protein